MTAKNNMALKNKLLLHVCCIGCGAYVLELLKSEYDITLYFYNPNVEPRAEYDKRLQEAKKAAAQFGVKLIEEEYENEHWHELVRGHENDLEKGERCHICYRARLEKTARYASEHNFDFFTTTLTISPHKDAFAINKIGLELGEKYPQTSRGVGINFLARDFKKQDGFKKTCELSRELNLYRQEYCGCGYSLKDMLARKK
jgi:hypothetical protein